MLLFLCSLGVVVCLHELGHLVIAKLYKCKVEVFSLGFGKRLFGFTYKGTDYRQSLIPFGGYCKLKNELSYSRSKHAFSSLPYMAKFNIAIAGIMVNCISGALATIIGFHFNWYPAMYFGILSIILGISNLIPLCQCLDGGYIVYYPMYIKKWGQKKGTELFGKHAKISLKIILWINILTLPYIIYLWIIKGLI